MSFDFNQIQSLQKLLNESSISHSPQQQQQPSMPTTKMLVKTRVDPTSPTSSSTLLISDDLKPKKKLACDPKEIWTDDEIPDETALLANNNKHDTRPSPKFTYFFKNSLGTEEIFLGMNHTSNSSIDSTHLVIKVHFPGSIMKVKIYSDSVYNNVRTNIITILNQYLRMNI